MTGTLRKLLDGLRSVAPECPRETDVLGALRARAEDPALNEHLGTCPRCAEVAGVAAFMRALAETGVTTTEPLPDPQRLWSRAELAELWEAERRAVAPIETVERAEPLVLVIALVVLTALAWPMLERWLQMGPPPELTGGFLMPLLLVGGGGVLLALILLVLRPLVTGRRELV